MKYSMMIFISLMLGLGISWPGRSQPISLEKTPTLAQNNPQPNQLTKAEILNACIQERAESLNYIAMFRPIIGHLKRCKRWVIAGHIVLPLPQL